MPSARLEPATFSYFTENVTFIPLGGFFYRKTHLVSFSVKLDFTENVTFTPPHHLDLISPHDLDHMGKRSHLM